MTLVAPDKARFALARFGLGVRAATSEAELAAIARDPVAALMADLDGPQPMPPLPDSAERARQWRAAQDEKKAARKADTPAENRMMPEGVPAMDKTVPEPADELQDIVKAEHAVRFRHAATLAVGFRERLVWFWSNHFCVSAAKGGMLRVVPGAYEREAIRPHVTGRFADMLLAAETHPAMLAYLDNARSVGPNSVQGRRRKRGLNENLAREILELHTLGVRSAYAQEDVTSFAKAITGWSFGQPDEDERAYRYVFRGRAHEPGPKRVFGRSYDEGEAGGRAVLADLARHPATARHVCRKLAIYFIADAPPAALVEAMEKAFQAHDGALRPVYEAMLTHPLALQDFGGKLRQPVEWLVAWQRGFDAPVEEGRMQRALLLLGQPLWRPGSPKGFAQDNAAWMDDVAHRVDVAQTLARSVKGTASPYAMVQHVVGAQAKDTLEAVQRAETRVQALTLALMSPDFLRR